jgi:hypothetical protein
VCASVNLLQVAATVSSPSSFTIWMIAGFVFLVVHFVHEKISAIIEADGFQIFDFS